MRFAVILAILPLTAVALPSVAQEKSSGQEKKKVRDPNEVVCENEEVLGSRLATRRVCMTRSQWADKQREDRASINRAQTQGCVTVNGQCTR